MEWITAFQAELDLLQDAMTTFISGYVYIDEIAENDQVAIEVICENLAYLAESLRAVPVGVEVWRFIDVYSVFRPIMHQLWSMQTAFDVLLLVRESFVRDNDPKRIEIEQLAGSLSHVMSYLHNSRIPGPFVSYAISSPFFSLLPSTIVEWLNQDLYPRQNAQHLVALSLHDWPLIIYHPYYVYGLLYYLSRRLGSGSSVSIVPQRTTNFFELSFTVLSLCLTPSIWDTLLEDLTASLGADWFERLREMGGEIEPLTWNEGEGEGVIVRLPWAHFSESCLNK